MILTATFEPTEAVPPVVWAQCRKALAHVLDSYGFGVTIREDRSAEMEAYQRYWAQREKERAEAAELEAYRRCGACDGTGSPMNHSVSCDAKNGR